MLAPDPYRRLPEGWRPPMPFPAWALTVVGAPGGVAVILGVIVAALAAAALHRR